MNTYPIIERPAKNVRLRSRNTGDEDLEQALLTTIESGKAIMLPLAKFHSSPMKSRLWRQGFELRHRVLSDRQNVGAWIEPKDEPKEEEGKQNNA